MLKELNELEMITPNRLKYVCKYVCKLSLKIMDSFLKLKFQDRYVTLSSSV